LFTCSQVWPVCRVGSYDGDVLDPNYVLGVDDWQSRLDDEGDGERILSWEFDSDSWDEAVVKAAQDAFDRNEPLKAFGVKRVVVKKYWHPREYNFVTDQLYLDVELDDDLSVEDWVRNAVKEIGKPEHKEKVAKFIKDNWKSRDGFTSFMPATSYDEFFDVAEEFCSPEGEGVDFERFTGSVLALLSLVNGDLDFDDDDFLYGGGAITEDIVEYLSQNYSASEFYLIYKPDEILKMNGIKEPDWDEEIAILEDACDKYRACFEEGSEQDVKCRDWLKKAHERINCLKADFLDTLDNSVDAYKDEKTGKWDFSKAVLKSWGREHVEDKIKEIEHEFTNGLKIDKNDSNY
jgi:hypothetical protein